jgi:hypothetical protein
MEEEVRGRGKEGAGGGLGRSWFVCGGRRGRGRVRVEGVHGRGKEGAGMG